jgi:CDP-glycerol glycerophosphotransferase
MNTVTSARNRVLDDIKLIVSSGLFDLDFYRTTYPDVAASGIHPIEHYVIYGATEGRIPRKDFDPVKYCAKYPKAKKINPFVHYIHYVSGKASAKQHVAVAGQLSNVAENQRRSTAVAELVFETGMFDAKYYLKTYPDVAQSNIDPLIHFVEYGAAEFRNPSAEFDTIWYWLVHQQNESSHLNPLVHYRTIGIPADLSIKAQGNHELTKLDDACKKFLVGGKPTIEECLNVATSLKRIGRQANAELIYSHICSLSSDGDHFHSLARLYIDQKKWWQAIDTLQIACQLNPEQAKWFALRGELGEKLHRFNDAIVDYTKALAIEPEHEQWLYRLGYLHSKVEDETSAAQCYEKSIKLSANQAVIRFGVGVHHQARGLWKEAAKAYSQQLENKPLDAELHYRLGMTHDRCFEWELAAESYKLAIGLDSTTIYWFYRLGFVLERSRKFEEAAMAYCIANTQSIKHEAYWYYRQGYALKQAGKFEEACQAYLKTSKNAPLKVDVSVLPDVSASEVILTEKSDQMRAVEDYIASIDRLHALSQITSKIPSALAAHIELAEELKKRGQWRRAAEAYGCAINRSASHVQNWYYLQGYCLANAGDFEEACNAFERTRIIKKAYGFDYSKYEKNASLKNAIEYNELIETLPVDDNVVLYESYHGASVSCNPFAIYTALASDPAYSHLTHVWALNDIACAPKTMKNISNVIFVERSSHLYRRYVATAKYLINNNTFMPWFVRRPEQKYLNTWHGTPMKGLGKDIKSTFMSHKNVSRNFLQATHLLSPNSHTSNVMITRHDIAGAFKGIIAETGYPRNDRVLVNQGEEQVKLAKRLQLDPARPTVLYAPTWRGTPAAPLVDIERLVHDLEALSRLNCNLLFRGHHMSEKLIAAQGFSSVPSDVETSALLSATDILITDYSSICFDFMPTGKPVIYYAYDYENYRRDRGMYLDIHTLPGVVVENCDKLCDAIESAFVQLDTKLEITTDNLQYLDTSNGAATQRAVELLLNDDRSHAVECFKDERKSILIYAGALPANGITQSCISLINAIDSTQYRVVLVIDPNTIEIEQYRLDKLESISDKVQIISRVGIVNYSPEEKLVVDIFNEHNTLHSEAMWDVYRAAMRKEFNRVFGCATFDTIIQFEGYGKFWTGLLSQGTDDSNKIIYLHNNMLEEYVTKYEFLAGIFKLYPFYEKLVSVSESVNEQNKVNLAPLTGVAENRFIYCDNYVNVKEIEEKSKEPLDTDIHDWVGKSKLFGTVGRLSPEKGHYKLISAFAEIVKANKTDAKLLIVGDGSQWSILQQHIIKLGLSDRVLLAGIRSNPYPIIKAMDLFVFSSDHEGQGLVVIEALILKKPVISTDIPGPHSILKPGFGMLVENSVQGLVEGMTKHIQKPTVYKKFCSNHYNKTVDKMFKFAIN